MTERTPEEEALEALKQAAPAEWAAWERAAKAWKAILEEWDVSIALDDADLFFAAFNAVGAAAELAGLADSLFGVFSPFKDRDFGPDVEYRFDETLKFLEGRSGPEVEEAIRAVKAAHAVWEAAWRSYDWVGSALASVKEDAIEAFEQEKQNALERAAPKEWKAYEAAKGYNDDPEKVAAERIYAAELTLKAAAPEKWTEYEAALETLRAAESALNTAAPEKWTEYEAAREEADKFEENDA